MKALEVDLPTDSERDILGEQDLKPFCATVVLTWLRNSCKLDGRLPVDIPGQNKEKARLPR